MALSYPAAARAGADGVKSETPMRLECKSHVWITPERILEPVRKYFGGQIPLDPATEPDNPTGAGEFYTEEMDGLGRRWDEDAFINPPYGSVLPEWCRKIAREASLEIPVPIEVIALLPCGARFSTKYFQRFLSSPRLNAVCFIGHRVPFLRPAKGLFRHYEAGAGNPYDSALYGFNVDLARFGECFRELGVCRAWGAL